MTLIVVAKISRGNISTWTDVAGLGATKVSVTMGPLNHTATGGNNA